METRSIYELILSQSQHVNYHDFQRKTYQVLVKMEQNNIQVWRTNFILIITLHDENELLELDISV